MANEEHLAKLKEGVEAWNQWRDENPDLEPDLQEANLSEAQLQGVNLSGALLHNVDLLEAQLQEADFSEAQLQGANLSRTQLRGADLTEVQLQGADFSEAQLQEADFSEAQLQGAALNFAQLQGAGLSYAQLQGASLRHAQLQGADLSFANLSGADLGVANLSGANLSGAQLQGADLSEALFDNATRFEKVILGDKKYGGASLVDVSWGGVNLAVVDWSLLKMLGDDNQASRPTSIKWFWNANTTLERYRTAVRANRQLAVVLRNQGLNEEADHFAYRAQLCQRVLWRLQRRPLKYILSWFLFLLAGYGYRPLRSLLWYLVVIVGFAATYFTFGHITPLEAFVLSLTSFHGRGFFPGTNITLSDPRVVLAAFEAVVGLFIEISFIATFTQRFFGR